jgi:transcriptional regulator with XRE-family HTH domain
MEIRKVTPIDKHIAKKLRQFRRASGITQDELGKLTGLSFQQVQKYEKAQNRISSSKLFEFSQVLKQPISAFFSELKTDQKHYKYDFKSEKQIVKNLEEDNKELVPIIRAFKSIKNNQVKKNLKSLLISIAKPANKKTKHWFSDDI